MRWEIRSLPCPVVVPAVRNLIDELTPDVVYGWVPKPVLEAAREDVQRGRVSKPALRPRRIDAAVADGKGRRVVEGYRRGGPLDAEVARERLGRPGLPAETSSVTAQASLVSAGAS